MGWAVTRVVVVISLLLFTGLAWWLPNALITPAMRLTGMERHDPDYYIENFVATSMNQQGTPRYRLEAAKLTHYPDGSDARLERPRLFQYGGANGETITTADQGLVSQNGKKLLMTGNVKVSRANGANSGSEIATNQLTVTLD
jgi:lipopolysaccharide export system protein LptC